MRKTIDLIDIGSIKIHYYEENDKRALIYTYNGVVRESIEGIIKQDFGASDKFMSDLTEYIEQVLMEPVPAEKQLYKLNFNIKMKFHDFYNSIRTDNNGDVIEGHKRYIKAYNLKENNLSFTVTDGKGLNNPVIKASNGDEIVITGMSYKDEGTNKKSLKVTPEMDKHYTEDFILSGLGGKKYKVTREVIIYRPAAKIKGGRFKSKIVSVKCLTENINEEKVETYKGYSIYRVPDSENDDFEIWKNGVKVMSCETSKEAELWIDDLEVNESELYSAVNKILEGADVSNTLLELLGNKLPINTKIADKLDTMCSSIMAEDIYKNSAKFQLVVGDLVLNYPTISNAMVQVEFAENKMDVDSSGVSLTVTSLSGGLEYIEVSKLKNGVLNPVKRISTVRYKEACNLFRSLMNNAEQIETDENSIFMIISFNAEGKEHYFEYEMPNPSYQGLPKVANESVINEVKSEKYFDVDSIRTNPKVKMFFDETNLTDVFYKFMKAWSKANEDYYSLHYPNLEVKSIKFSVGRNYIKVVKDGAVDCFIDKYGNVYKPASWNAPANGVRYYIDDYKKIHFDPHGSFLYHRNLLPKTADDFISTVDSSEESGEE